MKEFALKKIPLFGIFIFIFSNLIAMYFYPGGSIYEPNSEGYSFFKNYLSQLGRIKAINGELNSLSSTIWMSGMTISGFSFLIHYIYLPNFFNNKLSYLGSFFGIISCICFVLTGITPGDILISFSHVSDTNFLKEINIYHLHKIFANNIFYFGLACSFIYSYVIFKSNKISSIYGFGYYFFCLIVFVYVLILIYGPDPFSSEYGLIFQVTAQKIVAFSWVLSTFVLSLGILLTKND